jgi:hypothetical protein
LHWEIFTRVSREQRPAREEDVREALRDGGCRHGDILDAALAWPEELIRRGQAAEPFRETALGRDGAAVARRGIALLTALREMTA